MNEPIKSPTSSKPASKAGKTPQASAQGSEKPAVRKERTGRVTSAGKMKQTIAVEITRRVPDPRYRKIVKKHKKFYAHDEKSEAKEGDIVTIRETRPMSRLKRWELVTVHGAKV